MLRRAVKVHKWWVSMLYATTLQSCMGRPTLFDFGYRVVGVCLQCAELG